MFKGISESHERVINAVDDIKCCCEINDDFHQWSDVASSSIQSFLDDLSPKQLDNTCGAFMEYIEETTSETPNLAQGIKEALTICLKEMIDYIGNVPETDEEDDPYFYYNHERQMLLEVMKENLDMLKVHKTFTTKYMFN